MERRYKILNITPDLLVALLSIDNRRRQYVIEGMPADARIVNVSDQVGFDRDLISFRVESATFPDVPVGERIPLLELSVRAMQRTPPTDAESRAFSEACHSHGWGLYGGPEPDVIAG